MDTEYRDTGWHGLMVSRDGKFVRNGTPRKVRRVPKSGALVNAIDDGKQYRIRANELIARVWHPDYYPGCFIIPKDNDHFNYQLENLLIVSKEEHTRWVNRRIAEAKYGNEEQLEKRNAALAEYGEFRPTGCHDIEVTKEGVFRRRGRLLTVYTDSHHRSSVCVYSERKEHKYNAADLVARAWLTDQWFEGCRIIRKDGNGENICAANLHPCTQSEFVKRYKKPLPSAPKQPDWGSYGCFAPTGVMGIECTADGVFRRNGKLMTVRKSILFNNRKGTACIKFQQDHKQYRFLAADLVARAWQKARYYEGCRILYRDFNTHNICNDNLVIVSEERYNKHTGRSLEHKERSFQESMSEVQRVHEESGLMLEYMKTQDFRDINRYVERVMMNELVRYASSNLAMTRNVTTYVVQEVICHLYERIDANQPTWDFLKFCKARMRHYKLHGTFGYYEFYHPRKIEHEVQTIDIAAFVDKYKVTKLRTKK